MTRLVLVAIWSLLVVAAVHADVGDRAQAARALGYATYVSESRVCDAALTQQAATLRTDLVAFYKFTDVDPAVVRSVDRGRAEARHDARHPEYKGQFCDSMDEVLSVWRSRTLPPKP